MQPRVFDIHVDFVHHRIPITGISLEDLRRGINLPEGGWDVGLRKEAVILDFAGGRLLISERGIVMAQFRSLPIKEVKGLLRSLIQFICESFNWVPEDEVFSIDADLIVETPGDSPINTIASLVDQEKVKNMLGLKETIYGVGVTLFLSPLPERDRDFRIRLEPLASEPSRKYYLRISNSSREISLDEVDKAIDEMAEFALRISAHLEGRKR